MKILLLDLGMSMRGGQRQVFYLARALCRTQGFEPVVAAPAGSPLVPLLEAESVPLLPLPSPSDLNPLNILHFFKMIRQHKPDIVHTNDAKGASLAAMVKILGGDFRLVHSRRVSYPLGRGWSHRKYAAGDAVVGVSEEIRQVLLQCGVDRDKTETIHSGIDTALYSPGKTERRVLTIGAVGALSVQKGFDVLIDALGVLRAREDMPPWQCLIAGDGPLHRELTARAQALGLADAILFLGYRDSREVLPEMDMLIIPSVDGEGSNAVIKEGWATATPVITSDLPSNLELVEHGRNGLVFPNRDAKGLAAAIARLTHDHSLAQALSEEGARSVRRFTDTAMAEGYMALYGRLAARKS